MVTEDHIKKLVSKTLGKPVSLQKMNDNYSTTVWRIVTNQDVYYLRYHANLAEGQPNIFEPEVIALEQAAKVGAQVPSVLDWSDSCVKFPVPYVVLSEIPGKAVNKDTLTKEQIDAITFEAGKDIALVNSIPAIKFGHCNDRRTIENRRITGNDDSWYNFIQYAESESLVLYEKKKLLSAQEAECIRKIFEQGRKEFAISKSYLVHGDFDLSHIFQDHGIYTGIIDFGDKRCFDPVYDIAHFNMYAHRYTESLAKGWIASVSSRHLHSELDLHDLTDRIGFYTIAIALNKGHWVMSNIKKMDPKIFVKAIVRSINGMKQFLKNVTVAF